MPSTPVNQPPAEFLEALLTLRSVTTPPHLTLSEIPAPKRIAPFAAALHAQSPIEDDDLPIATGRFIILYNPEAPIEWGAKFRIITQIRSEMDAHLGEDPLLGQVVWSWLHDALDKHSASVRTLNGTVTREHSETFGGLVLKRSEIEVELKASWSTDFNDLAPHFSAWLDLVTQAYGNLDPDSVLAGSGVYV